MTTSNNNTSIQSQMDTAASSKIKQQGMEDQHMWEMDDVFIIAYAAALAVLPEDDHTEETKGWAASSAQKVAKHYPTKLCSNW
jgi:hypothetical protein